MAGSPTDLIYYLGVAHDRRIDAYWHIFDVRQYMSGTCNGSIIDKIRLLLDDMYWCMEAMLNQEVGGTYPTVFQNWVNNVGLGGDELTATAICEAWGKNNFEDRALTIAFIDRMRQLIWDEPFYIKWAARPEESES